MKHIYLLLLFSLFISCTDNTEEQHNISQLERKQVVQNLEKDFMTWWMYHSDSISLSSDFVAMDEDEAIIEKAIFLNTLTDGKHMPLKINTINRQAVYQLIKLSDNANKGVISTIKNESLTAQNNFKLEGQQFPAFEVKSLSNNHFSTESIKGKKALFKTWFIGCKACVAEFPELNEFVKSQRQKENLLFISLATDDADDLEKFLIKKPFAYEVIPNQNYIIEQLKLQVFPTHIFVDENGIIRKVCSKFKDMKGYLEFNNIIN